MDALINCLKYQNSLLSTKNCIDIKLKTIQYKSMFCVVLLCIVLLCLMLFGQVFYV